MKIIISFFVCIVISTISGYRKGFADGTKCTGFTLRMFAESVKEKILDIPNTDLEEESIVSCIDSCVKEMEGAE